MHNRLMFSVVGYDERSKFNKYFGELMLKSIVESIVGHWPQELKDGITRDVLRNLEAAEVDYATSKDILWNKEDEMDSIIGDSLLAKLTRNIASYCGYEMIEYMPGINITKDPENIMDVSFKVLAAFIYVMEKMKLQSIMKEVTDALKNTFKNQYVDKKRNSPNDVNNHLKNPHLLSNSHSITHTPGALNPGPLSS